MFCTALSSVFSSHNNFHSPWQRSNHQIKIQLDNIILYILIPNSNLLEWEEKHGKCLELSFHYFQQLKSFDALNLFNSVNSGNHSTDRGMEPNINIMLDLDKWSDSSQPLAILHLLPGSSVSQSRFACSYSYLYDNCVGYPISHLLNVGWGQHPFSIVS